MRRSSLRGLARAGISAVLLAGLAGTALAQDSGSDPVLRGPKVKDNSAPGERSTFGGGRPKGKDAQRLIPQPVFMKAVMSLNAEGAPEETRLSDEQAAKLKTIEQEFRGQQREFAQAHRDEVRELASKLPPEDRARIRELMGAGPGGDRRGPANQAKAGQGKRPGKGEPGAEGPGKPRPGGAGRPGGPEGDDRPPPPPPPPGADGPDEMMDGPRDPRPSEAEVQEARGQLKALIEQAPKPEQARAKMWAVLSEPQRKIVEAELVKAREEMGAKAGEAARKKKAGGDAAIDINDPRIPEKARERLKNLPPEQREEALKRLKERREGEQGKRPPGRKPPPPIEDVNIPAPDEPK